MNTQASCDRDRLQRYLTGELGEDETARLVEHLDDCCSCRERLEASAGEPSWWHEVRTLLSPDGLDEARSTCTSAETADELAAARFAEDSPGENGDSPHASDAVLGKTVRAMLAPTDDPRMLGRLGTYEIVGIVGRGATGIVLKAFQPSLNRYVALKVLSPELAANPAARRRFSREAQAAAAVVHDHVVPIYSVDEFQGIPYFVMRYVAGGSLDRRLALRGPLEVREVLRIGMQAAAGLAAAHAQGLVHRDIKPANILLEPGVERVLITDFGLARAVDDASVTRSGFLAGTPQYMSPEQARGETVDHRADLFGLGSVLYALCTGHSPFRAETAYAVLRRICDARHRALCEINPDVPEWLSTIVDRLLAKSPDDRPQTAGEVAELLEDCLAHVQNPQSIPLPESLRRPRTLKTMFGSFDRWQRVVIAAAVLLVAALAVIAVQVGFARRNHDLADQSASSTDEGQGSSSQQAKPAEASDSKHTPASATLPATAALIDPALADWNRWDAEFLDVRQRVLATERSLSSGGGTPAQVDWAVEFLRARDSAGRLESSMGAGKF